MVPIGRCRIPHSIRSLNEYNDYVSRYGYLVTDVYNRISGLLEEDSGVYFILARPGSGKSFLLFQLQSEYLYKMPVIHESFSHGVERAREFVNRVEEVVARRVSYWLQSILGRDLDGCEGRGLLRAIGAVSKVLGSPIRLLVLVDEFPLAEVQLLEELLRRLDGLEGFNVHVVVTGHLPEDVPNVYLDKLRERGAVQRYRNVAVFTSINVDAGHEDDALKFVEKLSSCGEGPSPLDSIVKEAAVKMLKDNRLVFRHVARFIEGALEAHRRDSYRQIQGEEAELHDRLVEELRRKWGALAEKPKSLASKPDLILPDETCVEVKVRVDPATINTLQHAGCKKVLYVVVSPQTPQIPSLHIRADVAQIASALRKLREVEGHDVYKIALSAVVERLAEEADRKRGVSQVRLPQHVSSLCQKVRVIIGSQRVTRSHLAKSASFTEIVDMVLADQNLSAEQKKELQICRRERRADCVELLARLTERLYGKSLLKVSGSQVAVGPLCEGVGQTAGLLQA